jgi:hypothetical protein
MLFCACAGAVVLLVGGASAGPTPPLPHALAALGDSITTAWGSGVDGSGANVAGDNLPGSWATGNDAAVDSQASRIAQLVGSAPATVNLAVAGRKVTDPDGVVWQATQVPAGTDYVLVETGSADLCGGGVTSVSDMPTVGDFGAAIEQTLTTLTTSLPDAHILLASIPNWYALWRAMPATDRPEFTCPLLFSPDPTVANAASREALRQQTIAYNTALAQACAGFAACRYDGGAAYALQLAPDDVSTYDRFHLSVHGQAKLAAATWAASWWSGDAAPANTSPPSITGTPVVGTSLSAVEGTWTGLPAPALTEKWLRCDPAGAQCTEITGATNTSYVVAQADVGATLRVQVTATNVAGSVAVTSAATATVQSLPTAPPAVVNLPSVSGVAQLGQTLTGSNGTWKGQPTSYTGQWLRCNQAGAACAPIAGATNGLYTLTGADLGQTIRFGITATNAAGSTQATSPQTQTVVVLPNPLRLDVVFENTGFYTIAVDRNGVAYGTSSSSSDPGYRLYRSLDEGRTWTALYDFPVDSSLTSVITVLSNNTLLASVLQGGVTHLFRSGDAGVSWTDVFQFPPGYQTLTAHSIGDDGSYVYLASYNVLAPGSGDHTNWIWRSADDGRTWSVVLTTTNHRHVHFVQVDPGTGYVYAGYGDLTTQAAIERSTDHGSSWQPVCSGDSCQAVDLAFDGSGAALFGGDTPAQESYVRWLDLATGTTTAVAGIPGPSYSSFNLGGGVWLVGQTREPTGVYPPGDVNVHLLGSNDNGRTFADVFQRPFLQNNVRLTVQFAYPGREFPIQITQSGAGTIVARVRSSRPINTAVPSVSGSARVGATLTSSQGTWTGAQSYAYQWQRCPVGGVCEDIAGAVRSTYTPVPGDIGSVLRAGVIASNGSGSTPAFSAQTEVVVASGFSVTSSIVAGQRLSGRVAWTATPSGIAPDQVSRVVFVIDGVPRWTEQAAPYVYGGDNATLDTAGLSDGQHTFTVYAFARDGSSATTSATATVANGSAPRNLVLPRIIGDAAVGRALTATTGTWANSPTSYRLQWRRCDRSGAGCSPIAGATSASYTPVPRDVGGTLTVAVTAQNSRGSSEAVSLPTGVVAALTCARGQFAASYFDNRTLSGIPVLARCESNVNHDWGTGAPAPGLPADNFSVRWTGTIDVPEGTYRFGVTVSDGVRIRVDGRLVLDKWFDQGPTTYRLTLPLSRGSHAVVVEYYEHTGHAILRFGP